MQTINKQVINSEVAASTNFDALNIEHFLNYNMHAKWTVTTPAAKTFVDADVSVANDTITEAAHGFKTGLKGQLTTSGVLPAGLALATDYFVIVVDADTFKLATSLVNAQAGTAVNITAAAGGGTHTFTSTALAGASAKLQASNNYDSRLATGDWIDVASSSTSITATGEVMWNVTDAAYKWVRTVVTLTAGQLDVDAYFHSKKYT